MRLAFLLVLATIVAALCAASSSARNVLTVCPSGCEFATISDALAAASSGDVIRVGVGTYQGGFTIDKDVTLVGAGAERTAISGGDTPAVTLSYDSSAVIRDLAVSGNHTPGLDGGTAGIDNEGTLRLVRATIADNISSSRYYNIGGLQNNGQATIVDSAFTGNDAHRGAAAISNGGTMTVLHTAFTANDGGSAIENYGPLTIAGSVLSGNVGHDAGGVYNFTGGSLTLIGSTLSGNRGVYVSSSGGIYNDGTALLVASTVADNTGLWTGGLLNNGSLTLRRSVVTRNAATWGSAVAGGIWNDVGRGATVLLTHSAVFGNTPEDCVG